MSQSRGSRTSRVNRDSRGPSQNESNRAPSGEQGAPSRNSKQAEETRQSQMSNRSPAAISRTPSADRRLLRTLTVSPNTGEFNNEDDEEPVPETPYSTRQPTQNRQSTRATADRTPAESRTGTITRVSKTPSEDTISRRTIGLPSPETDNRGEDWQANKTVPQANNYMLKYEVGCDITFTVGDAKEEIRAHKYMLMARSPVLYKSLIKHLGNMDIRIGVPDIKPDCFRDMLQYIYTDEFDIHSDNVGSMLYAAKKFQLKGLTNRCFQYLDAEMHDETVSKIMEQAHIYSETALYEKCIRFTLANGNSVLRKPGFSELCTDCVSRIIKSDDLRASEEAVFEGCMIWANAECKRQKKQPTDQNRREVLGKILYLIRFPVMDVTYFTQKVSLGNLLSHDETLSIFQYYHGEEQQLPNRFSRNERNRFPRDVKETVEPLITSSRTQNTSRVRRFLTTDGQWKQNGPPDSISFTVSHPIVLYGVDVFGSASGQETYAIKILIYDDITREEIRKNDCSIYTSSLKQTYEVLLARPLRVPARRMFTVMIMMKGNPTHKGVEGQRMHVVDGVQFDFSDSNRSSNGTDVNVGQIAAILFSKTQ